jgi:peptide/nickel transport system substrate-binding protein
MQGIALPLKPDDGGKTLEGNPQGNNVTCDPAIREALNIGINRSAVMDTALNGYGEPSTTGVAKQLPYYYDNFEDGKVDEAKKILDEAGWKDTNGDGIRDKNGTEASFTLWYYSTLAYRESIDIAVAEQAKELGIDMKLQGSNWDDIEGEFSTMSIVWGGGGCDPSSLANYFDSRQAGLGYNNPTIMNDSNVDSLIDSARSQDLNSSYPTWSQAFQAANEHDPYIWIGSVDYTYFVSDNLDISEDTSKVFPHGGDIWGNVYDWKPVNETSK